MNRKKATKAFFRLGSVLTRVQLPSSPLVVLMVFLAVLSGCQTSRVSPQIRPHTSTARLVKNADYLKKSGRVELAVKELEEAHLQDPGDMKILDVLIQCYEELGHFDRAQELYKEGLSRGGHHPALENNRCYSLFLQGRLGQAEACFRKVLARYPDNQTARNNLGLVLCRQGREDDALALWREAMSDTEARQRLGQALASLGREVPPRITGLPLVAAAKPSQTSDKEKARSESQPSSQPSTPALPVPPGQPTATLSAKHPAPMVTTTPKASAVVAQLSSSAERQSQLPPDANMTNSPSLPAVIHKPAVQTPNPTSAREINQGSLKIEKSVATKGSTDTAPALASPDLPPSSLPEKFLAKTSPDTSESTSTPKMEVKEQTQASIPALTTEKLPETQAAVPVTPVTVAASPPEVDKESALPAPKPSIDKNTQASTVIQPAGELQVTQHYQPFKQLLSRLLSLIRKEESAAHASSFEENTSTSTPVLTANKPHETQVSPAPKVTVAAPQSSKIEESGVPSSKSSLNGTLKASTDGQPVQEPYTTQLAVPVPQITVATSSYDKKDESAAPAANPPISEDTIVSIPVLTSKELHKTRIELKNGNGVQNHARDARRYLSSEGFTVVGIGNHIDFGLEKTIIAYRPEAARVAQVLSQKFFPEASFVKGGKLSPGADIRVSLGRDLVPKRMHLAQGIP